MATPAGPSPSRFYRRADTATIPIVARSVYADDGFAISAPTQPSQDKWTQKSPAGPVEVHFYGIGLNAGSEFSITATNLNLADRRTPQRILTDGKNGAAAAVKGKVVSETSITLGKYPGMQLEMETLRFHSRARQYVVGRTSYELLVLAPPDQPLPAETDRLFSSSVW